MKVIFLFSFLSLIYIFTLWKWGGMDQSVLSKWESHVQMEKKALVLAKENRLLEMKVSDLQFKISQLESQNKFFTAQLKSNDRPIQKPDRQMASVPIAKVDDLVQYEVYKWTPDKLLAIGEKEFHFKNYDKSSQFYSELIERFPKHEIISDRVLFGAGISAFETGKRYDWTEKYLSRLIKEHPQSDFYRGAKLWLALAQYNQGEKSKFVKTVEEFRVKYRNTEEWKILSRYYEDISNKVQ